MIADKHYLSAREAAAALGVSLSTLYSYVSRGMLRSESVAGQPRLRRYLVDDVRRFTERKEARRDPAKAAARGLHWGSPVLESSLTLISGGRIYYRGRDALELAQHATVEEVAALLWTGDTREAEVLFAGRFETLPRPVSRLLRDTSHAGPIERCQLTLPVAASYDAAAHDLRPHAVPKTGARILRLMFSAVCGRPVSGPMEGALCEAWMPRRKHAVDALRAALILCADHELNVSAFTARCIASAAATPYDVVCGALAALKGRRHGGTAPQIEALFLDASKTRHTREALTKHLRVSGALPGFGHALYPEGDPRAMLLLTLAKNYGRRSAVELAERLAEAAQRLTGEHPTLDFGLVALRHAFGLPQESPLTLFALGRTTGWIAHAIEQYGDPRLIRPRARYIGGMPIRAS